MLNSRRPKGSAVEAKKSKSGTTVDQIHHDQSSELPGNKRQGDNINDLSQKKRSAFGDITNALADKKNQKDPLKKSKLPSIKAVTISKQDKEVKSKKSVQQQPPPIEEADDILNDDVIALSQESWNSSSQGSSVEADTEALNKKNSEISRLLQDEESFEEPVDDVDKENLGDPTQVALYAFDIFQYYKDRELLFMVPPYMSKQVNLTSNMRAILVDWLVEVQENFELNHETLYLAVKLVDTYLSITVLSKEMLQLVGAVALFVSCKFDERLPPLIQDFLYICDDAYKRRQFLGMEQTLLKSIGFDIGMPLSYRFLRRYAKCARSSMETLTLARYILEMSLMEYEFIKHKESQIAAAALLLAMKMKKTGSWNRTLEYYTGYTISDLSVLMNMLHKNITSPPKQLTTIRSKYSHKVFYEVAKTPLLTDAELNLELES